MASVVGLWRYPVKSAAPQPLSRMQVTPSGVVGDRGWAVLDGDGTIVSAKHPKRGGRLLDVGASYDEEADVTTVDIPGRGRFDAGGPDADRALSEWLGRPVRLTRDRPEDARLQRLWPEEAGLLPPWAKTAAAGREAVTDVAGPQLRGSFVDYGAVHIVTTSALRRLSELVGRPVDPTRFRPNLLLDADQLPPGGTVDIGGVAFEIEIPTPRCVVPGIAADGRLEADLLRTLARFERRPVSTFGVAACFGAYAVATAAGEITLADAGG